MPLFGDMKMKPFDTYVKNSVHFNANKWPLSNSTTTSNQVDTSEKRHSALRLWCDLFQANLLYNLEKMREDHIKFACELSRWVDDDMQPIEQNSMHLNTGTALRWHPHCDQRQTRIASTWWRWVWGACSSSLNGQVLWPNSTAGNFCTQRTISTTRIALQ